MADHGVEEGVRPAAQLRPGQQAVPEHGGQGGGQGGLNTVHRPPVPAEEDQIVLHAVLSLQKVPEMGVVEAEYGVSRRLPGAVGEKDGGLEQGGGGVGGVLTGGEAQRRPGSGGGEDAPVRGQISLPGGLPGGVAPAACEVVEVEAGVVPGQIRGGEELPVDCGVLRPLAGQGQGEQGAFPQPIRRLLQGGKGRVHGETDRVQLLRHLLPGLPDQAQAENLQQHGRADEKRHQRGDQKGREQPAAKGERPSHTSSSPPR